MRAHPFDRRRVGRAFAAAANGYERAAKVQRLVRARLLERVPSLPAELVLDVGCGSGGALPELARRLPGATVVGLDLARPMLVASRPRGFDWRFWRKRPLLIQADAAALPIVDGRADLLYSNLCLQWLDPAVALPEWQRVLRPGGWLLFATFGPGTLKELREAFAEVDASPHVHEFPDLMSLGDLLLAGGWRDPVVDTETLCVQYPDPGAVMRDLRAIGAGYAHADRRRTLSGARRFAAMAEHYRRKHPGPEVPASFEIVYGRALAPEAGRARAHEVRIAPSAIRRPTRR